MPTIIALITSTLLTWLFTEIFNAGDILAFVVGTILFAVIQFYLKDYFSD